MIDKFCDWITRKIKENVENIDEEKELVIDFGIRLIFGELPKIILIFILGFVLNIGWYTLILFFLLAPYRSFVGGFHLKTHIGCIITTTFLYLGPIIFAKYFAIPKLDVLYILSGLITIFSIIVIIKYAPADTENIPILTKKERKSKRIKAYIALAILLAIIILSPDRIISYMFIYGIFLEDLTALPIAYKITKNKYGYEVYAENEV